MKQLIENVVQWGRDRGLDKVGHLAQAKYTLKETAELLDAYADGDIDKINDAIGDILVTLIVGASNNKDTCENFYHYINEKNNDNSACFYVDRISELVSDVLAMVSDQIFEFGQYNKCVYTLQRVLLSVNCTFSQSLSLQDCLQLAYDEIKNRTGKLVNGQFIKD